MLTTTQLRKAWGPACASPSTRVTIALNGAGRITVERRTEAAFHALNACLVKHNYLTRRNDTGAYNCRRITGGSGFSLHAYGIAADINWSSNPYGRVLKTDMPPAMRADIKSIRTRNGRQVFGWGGDYRTNKDAMHYEVVCSPKDLATGIDPATVPSATPAPPPDPNKGREWHQFVAGATDEGLYAKGYRNDGIAETQMLLKKLDFYRGPITGEHVAASVSAVIAFKDAAGWHNRTSLVDLELIQTLRTIAAAKKP